MTVCAACGKENPDGFRFCGGCGAQLGELPAREVRKVVTVLFCDLIGSTALGDQADPENLRRTMAGYYDRMRAALERHGGTVEKFIGDAVMAVFGVPESHEDDALRAVRAAVEMREAAERLGLGVRIGVNTGPVVTADDDTLVTGDAVNVAARLEQHAEAGEILLGEETRRLVRNAVETRPARLTVKGKPEPLNAHRLVSLDTEAPGVARRLGGPMVGRARERRRLRDDFEDAVAERTSHLFTLLGAPGVGKSRLVADFTAAVDARVVAGRCLHYGEGITYWPLVQIVKQLGGDVDAVIGPSPAETQLSFRKLLEAESGERPLVVGIDDLQWAEPTFLDLLEHVVDWSRGTPIFLLCIARPELLDLRPGWGGGKPNATTMLLEPLPAGDAERLFESLVSGPALDGDARSRILAAAEGNPLFVEEMVALAQEAGEVTVPPSIQALLQARLDRLLPEERTVVERGAVEGEVFHRGAVEVLAPEQLRDGVPAHLKTLVRKDLIRPDRATLPDDDAFRFRHLLIRDAAYDALPKRVRADLHERFAVWLEEHAAALVELDEIAGWHFEQAVRYAGELDLEPDEALADRAVAHLAAAGRRATTHGDKLAAASLLRRAAALSTGSRRLELLVEAADAMSGHAYMDALDVLAPALESDDERIRLHAQVVDAYIRLFAEPETAIRTAEETARNAISLLEPSGDDLGLARAWNVLALVDWERGQAERARDALRKMIEHARNAGDAGLASWALGFYVAAAMRGPAGPAEMDLVVAEAERDGAGSRYVRQWILRIQAYRALLEGRLEDARAGLLECRTLLRELGLLALAATSAQDDGRLEILDGRPDVAERLLRDGCRELEQMGERSWQSTTLAWLAVALVEQGALDEAVETANRALAVGSAEDTATISTARRALSRVHLARGEVEEALAEAAAAVAVEEQSDMIDQQAGALTDLAAAQAAAGLSDEARASLAKALELYGRKGAPYLAEHARNRLASLALET